MASDDGILKDFMPGIATVAVLKRNNYSKLYFQDMIFQKSKHMCASFKLHMTFMTGVYYFSKIVNYADLDPLKPASTIVKGVR